MPNRDRISKHRWPSNLRFRTLTFFFGLFVLFLFAWYFLTDKEKTKRGVWSPKLQAPYFGDDSHKKNSYKWSYNKTISCFVSTGVDFAASNQRKRELRQTSWLANQGGQSHIGQRFVLESTAIQIVRTALDSGVNFLDNCRDYNDGLSEERMGKALRDGYRDKAFLMTKVDGHTAQSASQQLDQSLQRLQTDHLDLIQIHAIEQMDEPEQVLLRTAQ